MTTTQIDYPNCEINIVDELGNYTKLHNNSSTHTGLKIFTQNGTEGNNSAEVTSNSINLSTVYPDNSTMYREFGHSTILLNTNQIGETRQGIFSDTSINYINNQNNNNLNMFYKGTGIETNNAFNIVSTDTLSIDAPNIDISGQSSFNQPPHSVDPIYGNDLATKGYVDSLVGQYSGGYNLFFNYSVTDSSFSSYKQLGQSVVTSTQQIVDIHTNSGPILVAQFITLPVGITEIPAGLWNVWIYGAVDNTNGELQYYFTLLKFDGTTETLISTSSLSPDVNASPNNNPDSYHMNATISNAYSISTTDRVIIKLYVQKSGGTSVTIRTFFQNSYYSFTQSTLNAGTTLLSSNNTWIGTNTYPLGITTPSISNTTTLSLGTSGQTTNLQGNLQINASAGSSGQVLTSDGTTATWATPTTSQWVNNATSDLSMNTYTIHTNTIYPNTNNATLNIASNVSRSGTLNIQTSSTTTNAINIGSSTSTTTLGGTFLTNSIDALTGGNTLLIGNTNANGVTIGKINQATNISGNLQIAGSAGSSGQILTSNGTTATWESPITNSWINTATSDLNMSIYSINTDTINPTTTSSNLNIASGTGRSGQVNIQTTATGTNTINIGSDNSTTNIKGLKTSNIDTATSTALTIGNTSASSITIGKSGIQTTINGTLESLTSTINTIQGNGANTTINTYIDNVGGTANMFTNSTRSGTLNIQTGSTSANTINIGSATTTTNLYGLKTPSIDTITSTTLNIGNTTAAGVNIGRLNQTTNLSGNLQIAGSAGSSGQVLTSNGTTALWTTITSGWINTATSSLNMSNYSINNVSSIDSSNSQLYIGNVSATGITIGKSGITTIMNGNAFIANLSINNLYVNQSVILDNLVGRTVLFKNSSNSNDDYVLTITKTTSNLANSFYFRQNQVNMYSAVINSGINNYSYTTQWTPSLLIFITQSQNSTPENTKYEAGCISFSDNSTYTTTIDRFKIQSTTDYSVISNVSVTMKAPNIYILGATQIDASNTQLSIGNTSANGVLIGRSGQTTNLQGNLQIAGSAGSSGQVLTSNGTTALWTTITSGWVNTATSILDMASYNIINTSSIDTNNISLKLGNISASGVIIGRAGQVTDILGNLQIAGSAGSSGQVLTSNGTTATWANSTSGWGGTATSILDMATYSIINTSSIDTNNISLKLGNTSASGVIIGRAGQVTDLNGNLQIAGSAGSSGQVLTSDGTTATWTTPTSGWTGTATSNLSMSTYSINTNTINPINVSSDLNIALGSGRSGQVNIQTTATGINTINIGSDNSTTIIKGLKTSSIDTNANEALSIGETNATGISIGKTGITTTITGLQANSLTSNIISANGVAVTANLWNNITTGTPSILTGATTPTVNILTNSDRNGITNIQTGATLSNTINIGSATTTTTLNGVINASIIKNCSSIDNSSTLYIGNVSATDVNIGRSAKNINIMGTLIAYTSLMNDIGTYGASNAMTLWFGSTDGTANILGRGIRTGILNIQAASTLANTINIGSATTTTTLGGVVNASTIKNCSFIDNSGTIVIGNLSSTGITIGRAGQITNIRGNIGIAGNPGTNGQVLTSNGTTATWASPASGWNGTATSNLSMTNNVIRIKNTSTLSENRWPTNPQVDGIIIESTSDVNTFNVIQNTGLSIYSDTGLAAIYKDRFSFTDQTIGTTVTNYGGKNIISDSYSALFPDHPFQFGIYGILLKDLTKLAKYDTTGITFANFQSGTIDTIDYSSYNTKINTSQLISTNPYTIQNSSTLTINSSTLNLNTTSGTSNINIGTGTNSGTITIGNSSTTALNIGEPITPTYTTYNATTGTNIAGTIGYIIVGTGTITNSTATQTAIRTISSLPVGVWILIGSIHYNSASTWVSTSISTTTSHNFASGNITGAAGANNAHTCTRIVVATTSTVSYYLVTNSNSNCTLAQVTFQALRIA